MKRTFIRPVFVEFIPKELEDGVLYISKTYGTAAHKCACGWCGEKVVTPLSPVDWQLRVDGDLVSLRPSIGNWNFPCRSHYWIRRNRIQWAPSLSETEIQRVQQKDLTDKKNYIEAVNRKKAEGLSGPSSNLGSSQIGHFRRILRGIGQLLSRFTG